MSEVKEEVVITMTSWKKRINDVSKTIYSLLRNTYKPRSIELNLAEEEFPLKEKELPEDLLLLKNDGLVHISKMSNEYIKHPSEVVSVGDIVDCYVDEILLDKKKVSLSLIER